MVNGTSIEVPEGASVADVLNRFTGGGSFPRGGSRGTAVALADEVVPAGQWATTRVAAGDRLEVVRAVSGG